MNITNFISCKQKYMYKVYVGEKWPLIDRYFSLSKTITFRHLGTNNRQVITIFNLYCL